MVLHVVHLTIEEKHGLFFAMMTLNELLIIVVTQPLLSLDNHLSRMKLLDNDISRWSGFNAATHFGRGHYARVGCG